MIDAAYVHVRPGKVARTVEVSDSVMVDVDAGGRIIGVETLDGSAWLQALATLAMQGRLAVVPGNQPGEEKSTYGIRPHIEQSAEDLKLMKAEGERLLREGPRLLQPGEG